MRLFVALVPPEPVRCAVWRRGAERRASFPAASWAREENLHATLLFLGEVDETRLPELEEALAGAARGARPLRIGVATPGAFPPSGRIRVVWIGLEPAGELVRLASAVRAAARRAFAFDEKPFRPHLTLARCRSPWPAALRSRLAELAPPSPLGFEARAIELVESRLGAGGPRYRSLAALALGEAA